jgi:hypothetical protein
VTLNDHAERIADEQHIDARAVGCGSERRVVGGQHRDLVTVFRHAASAGTVTGASFGGEAGAGELCALMRRD